jgi:hypothetical protein
MRVMNEDAARGAIVARSRGVLAVIVHAQALFDFQA